MPKTFDLWNKIFTIKNFDLNKDIHYITADEIKLLSGAEPRLMAKMDSKKDVPPIFKNNGYFLLPVKNGTYAIVRGEGFHLLEPQGGVINHVSRIKFNLTTLARGICEIQYLDYIYNSGTLESVVVISPLYQSIRGREHRKQFSFSVNKTTLDVDSVQLEVDSGLEGEDSIVLIEAKVRNSEDFIIRQLFYPFNHFKILSPNKKIIPVFFTYDPRTAVYSFWIYEFTDPKNYNSIRLKDVKSLTITTEREFELFDIKPRGVVTYKDLIPQANDVNKIIELAFKVNEGIDHYKNVADYFKFNERQSSYYREAAEALGLVVSERGKYKLTPIGEQLVSLPGERRNLFVVELLSDFSLVKSGLDTLNERGHLEQSDLEKLVVEHSNLSGSTISRRASSLGSWFRWIGQVTGSFVFEDGYFTKKK